MTVPVALIVGAGPGISGAFASRLVARGYAVALAARHLSKLEPLATSMNGRAYTVEAGAAASVSALFSAVEQDPGAADVVLFNAGALMPGASTALNVEAVGKTLQTQAMGAFA